MPSQEDYESLMFALHEIRFAVTTSVQKLRDGGDTEAVATCMGQVEEAVLELKQGAEKASLDVPREDLLGAIEEVRFAVATCHEELAKKESPQRETVATCLAETVKALTETMQGARDAHPRSWLPDGVRIGDEPRLQVVR